MKWKPLLFLLMALSFPSVALASGPPGVAYLFFLVPICLIALPPSYFVYHSYKALQYKKRFGEAVPGYKKRLITGLVLSAPLSLSVLVFAVAVVVGIVRLVMVEAFAVQFDEETGVILYLSRFLVGVSTFGTYLSGVIVVVGIPYILFLSRINKNRYSTPPTKLSA